jgi:hypothetical protein
MLSPQYSVHEPSPFMVSHRADLLPDWTVPIASVLVVLQHCPVPLCEVTPQTRHYKDKLRQKFLGLAEALVHQSQLQGYCAEPFDPKTGYPCQSRPGSLSLDDVAVISSVLGYPCLTSGACRLLQHPTWGDGVFPSVIVSTAPPEILEALVQQVCASPMI